MQHQTLPAQVVVAYLLGILGTINDSLGHALGTIGLPMVDGAPAPDAPDLDTLVADATDADLADAFREAVHGLGTIGRTIALDLPHIRRDAERSVQARVGVMLDSDDEDPFEDGDGGYL